MSSSEKAIERLKDLLTLYRRGKGNFLEQTSKTGPSWSNYYDGNFPEEISRGELLENAKDSESNLENFFVRIMAWGFGPAGYAHYRTNRILAELNTVDGRTIDGWMKGLISQSKSSPLDAFEYLESERGKIKYLGPAFATKVLYFLSPAGNRAPILDSVVVSWLWRHKIATEELSITLDFTNYDGYRKYIDFIDKALGQLSKLPTQSSDENDRGFIEYLIFQDQLAYQSDLGLENWMRRAKFELS